MNGEVIGSILVAVLTVVGSIIVARISRPTEPPLGTSAVTSRMLGDPARDLTTISGLAEVVVKQGEEIDAMKARQAEHEAHARIQDLTIQALRRYLGVLRDALTRTGAAVPEPDAADAQYIHSG